MGITIKHSPSAAAIGGSAYTIGRGEKQRWIQETAQKQQAAGGRSATGISNQARARAGQLALQEKELGLRRQQWEDEPARQLQQGLDQQKLLQSKVSWQYDEGQKREMAKVTTGVAWLRDQVSAGKWTAEQAEQAEQQLWRKYHSIIPLPVYDDNATPQERYNSNIVKDPITGAQYRMNEKGSFESVGIDFKDYAKLRSDVAKAFTSQITDPESKDFGKSTTDWTAVDKFVDDTMVRFTKIQGLASQAEEEKAHQQQRLQGAAADVQQEQQQVEQQASRKVAPAKREVAPEVDMTKLDEMSMGRIQQFKSMKTVKWSWVKNQFGSETLAELKYICESGNEQAIANALRRLGII